MMHMPYLTSHFLWKRRQQVTNSSKCLQSKIYYSVCSLISIQVRIAKSLLFSKHFAFQNCGPVIFNIFTHYYLFNPHLTLKATLNVRITHPTL